MNELDILNLFYDEMKNRGITRDQVFLSMEEDAAAMLTQKLKQSVSLESVQKLTDICIANEWLERTTADPNYKYLSLTEAGLQIILANRYS
ncbi:hypothetical protein DGG96_00215 [Legionella qingyii]|uniref:Uncharacterized protein n=1 Tax=Legionella qingyii TaxID=2184757 RepID=A0A317UB21_9GAMM|nr:hypothetical protein [Legionella qingyii]PWY57560.1 hypothetical protein DGG96_00215 [Legionella qingyii]RUR25972.1 hypothetical protein ELY20_02175 [Legionella qingyii]RUR29361.1 hypothetical protein ELY16_00800 [Legionella qingyii]